MEIKKRLWTILGFRKVYPRRHHRRADLVQSARERLESRSLFSWTVDRMSDGLKQRNAFPKISE